jgi:hypothetical protein
MKRYTMQNRYLILHSGRTMRIGQTLESYLFKHLVIARFSTKPNSSIPNETVEKGNLKISTRR